MRNSVKLYFLFSCFCMSIAAQVVNAQPYQSLFGQQNTYWIQYWINIAGPNRDSIYHEKDTLVYGQLYKKIKYDYEFLGLLLREDTLQGKVWGRAMPHPDFYPDFDTSEVLIYDFSLMKGDTFSIPIDGNDVTLQVDSVYYLNGKKHVSFRKEGASWVHPEAFEFIEGVGSNFCIEYFMPPWMRINRYLICAYKDDTVTYQGKRYSCDVRFGDISVANINIESGIHVYPNPVLDVLYLSCDECGDISVTITDIKGAVVQHSQYREGAAMQADMRGLLPGLYFIRIAGEHGSVSFQKILKQ